MQQKRMMRRLFARFVTPDTSLWFTQWRPTILGHLTTSRRAQELLESVDEAIIAAKQRGFASIEMEAV